MGLAETAARPAVRSLPQAKIDRLSFTGVALAVFLLWMPLQTPVAMLVYQYGHALVAARVLLLVKDFIAAALILVLLAREWRKVHIYWWDWAGIAYLVLIAVYSIVPWLLGSHISPTGVAATVREYVVPVELYILGRLAFYAGVDAEKMARWFLGVAGLAAVYTIVTDMLPLTFWSTTMKIVPFIRDVQGVPSAKTLWDVSILAQFAGNASDAFVRAIGPFTHPVGTGTYFMLPLAMAVAWTFESLNRGLTRRAMWLAALSLLFAAAVITPISRGSWIGAGLTMVILIVLYRRPAFGIAALALTLSLLLAVPPYTYSITSALNGTDSSTQGHASAIDKGTTTVSKNPLGSGVGHADQFGQIFSGGEGVGENTFIALWVSIGPFGLLAFLLFVCGLMWKLAATRLRAPPPSWIAIGSGASLIGYLAASMTSSALMRFTTSASVWLIVGLAVGLVIASRDKKDEEAVEDATAETTTTAEPAPEPAV